MLTTTEQRCYVVDNDETQTELQIILGEKQTGWQRILLSWGKDNAWTSIFLLQVEDDRVGD
jgi:hypothetical protein